MAISGEATFGPVAPVVTYDDVDHVIDLADDNASEGPRSGIGIDDSGPAAASTPLGGMEGFGNRAQRHHDGIEDYPETKLGTSTAPAGDQPTSRAGSGGGRGADRGGRRRSEAGDDPGERSTADDVRGGRVGQQ